MRKPVLMLVLVLPLFFSLARAGNNTASLFGTWQCRTDDGLVTLQFLSENRLNYNGEEIACQITDEVIRVEDEFFGYVDYPYLLKDGALSITYPEGYTLTFKKTAVKEKTGSAAGPPATGASDLVQHFAGTWKNYTKYSETMVVLYPDGTWGKRYTSNYSSAEPGEEWGVAGESHSEGRWTVRGNKERGVLLTTSNDGTTAEYEYQVHVENGEVYWSEYYFNGDLYGKVK